MGDRVGWIGAVGVDVSACGLGRVRRVGRRSTCCRRRDGNVAVALVGLLASLCFVARAVQAQVPPSPAEVAAYRGLQGAAQRGDRLEVERLVRAAGGTESTGRRPRMPPDAPVRALLEARDGHGRTPLHLATFAKARDTVRLLIDLGADPGALDRDRYDAVTIAAVADDDATLAVLLDHGASAKLVTSPYDGTALIAAAHLGHDGVVRRLLVAGAPPDHVNNLGWTALIEAVVLGDGGPRHQACVQALLGAGADRRIADRWGRTPLQLARERGYAAIVAALLDGEATSQPPGSAGSGATR